MNCIFSNKQLVANTTPRTKKLLRKNTLKGETMTNNPTDTNQTSEDELRDEILTKLEAEL